MDQKLVKNLEQEEWYRALIEECQAILTEGIFNYRWTLIKTYHLLGKRILADYDKFKKRGIKKEKEIRSYMTRDLNQSDRTIRRAVQFAEKFPDLNTLPEGKNISWYKICNLYLPEPKASKIELPEGKYRTLVIDPPWKIEKILREVRPRQVEMDYPTLTIEEIRDYKDKNGKPITDLFNPDGCHVYLWTTHKHLPDALEILKAWGVKYQCVLTWIKNVGITPYSWMYSTELVLFGRKGNLDLLKNGERLDFYGKVREHSRKPDEFYELVKRVSPAPRIDVFSREKRGGFDQYGNEFNKFTKQG